MAVAQALHRTEDKGQKSRPSKSEFLRAVRIKLDKFCSELWTEKYIFFADSRRFWADMSPLVRVF